MNKHAGRLFVLNSVLNQKNYLPETGLIPKLGAIYAKKSLLLISISINKIKIFDIIIGVEEGEDKFEQYGVRHSESQIKNEIDRSMRSLELKPMMFQLMRMWI